MNAADPAEIVGLVLATLAGTAWWARRRFQETQRRVLRAIQSLSDNLIASESPAEIAEKLVDVLPAITRASGVRVYLFNGSTNSLEYVPTDEDPEPMAIAVDSESEGLANAVVKCFA